ncbi:MAG TPA: hypothetical protein VGI39_44770 [Polyangiaceae bacterium]|jgi:hypothetical protein
MGTKLGWLVGSLAVVLAGCGGSYDRGGGARTASGWSDGESQPSNAMPAEPSSPPSGAHGSWKSADAPPPPPPAPSTASGPSGATASASPPPAIEAQESRSGGGSQWQRREEQPKDRPGLGTEWGEQRESHIHEVSFLRADPERPFATASLFYNDRHGVEALAAWHGGTPRFHDVSAQGGAITISLRDAWGESLDAMHVGDRTYVVGTEGERYSIVISNHTARRFEAVTTVDGLDVINGRAGNFENRGYLLMPHASLEIDGFRQSSDAVAAFRFAKVRDSYAAQTGDARNVGVIGIAFFGERGDDWSSDELRTRDTASPFPEEGRFARPPQ